MSWWTQSWWQQGSSWTGRSAARNWGESDWGQQQAGNDRQEDQEQEAGNDLPERLLTFPRFHPTATDRPRGQGKGGSSLGWGADSEEEWQPAWMRWSVLIDADLSTLGAEVRTSLFAKAKRDFDCTAIWRKDRHSENHLRVPYRLSVRGIQAQCCLEWILDELCSEHTDKVDIEDIWSTPSPQENHQLRVQRSLEGCIVKAYPGSERQRLEDAAQAPVVLRPPPDVWPQTCPGLVKSSMFHHARKMKQAGLTAKVSQAAPQKTAASSSHEGPAPTPAQTPSAPNLEEPAAPAAQPALKAEEPSAHQLSKTKFETRIRSIASEKHDALHWEYQEAMKDHCRELLTHVLEHGQHVPEDLKSSDVHQLIDDCHILLCCSTFKRNFQLQEALAMNVSQTWPWRRRVTWCIFDANPDTELWEWAKTCFSFAMQCGHIIWLRAVSPWSTFHMSVAKNAAHVSGFQASLSDRLITCSEAGLTATEAGLTAKTFVMNWDNDNILCLRWLHDCFRASAMMTSDANLKSVNPVVGIQWQNSHLGTCGRIGTTWNIFLKMGGYDESMLAMGCQDVCLVKRMGLVGVMEHRTGSHLGFTVSNREDMAKRLLGDSGKAKRKEGYEENAEKLKWLPEFEKSLGSFAAICKHNGKIMKARLKKKVWVVNEGKTMGVETVRYAVDPRVTLDLETASWPQKFWDLVIPGSSGSDRPQNVTSQAQAGSDRQKDVTPQPQAASDRQKDVTPQANVQAPPQAGSDRQAASSSQATPSSQLTTLMKEPRPLPFQLRHQILCVSLGTRTTAQVFDTGAAAELRTLFWADRRKLRGVTWQSNDLARRVLTEAYRFSFPDACTFDLIDCREFHGKLMGHVGLHPTYQKEYLDAYNAQALQYLCDELCGTHRAYPLEYQSSNVNLQRVFVFYCNAGEHRSVSFAALVGAMMEQCGAKVRLIQTSSEIPGRTFIIYRLPPLPPTLQLRCNMGMRFICLILFDVYKSPHVECTLASRFR